MFDKCFSFIFELVSGHKFLAAGLMIMITIISGVGLKTVSFDNNIELMLPANEEISRSIIFFRESNLSNKVILSFKLNSLKYSIDDLLQVVDNFTKNLTHPLITDVLCGISETDALGDMLALTKYVPQLMDEQALLEIKKKITPDNVQKILKNKYLQILTPQSTFMMQFIRSDPLDINVNIFNSLQKLSLMLGYHVKIKNGHFVSSDNRCAMIIISTPVTITDGFGSKKLIAYLSDQLDNLPDFASADIISGHLHTVSNENVIKKDIQLTLIIASISFLLLFLFIFKDLKALMLFFIPIAAVLLSINLAYIFLDKLSYFIIGMGGVVAGIAVDYGIHVFMAVRANNGEPEAVKQVAKPVVIGALTTIGIFASFFFSDVQGYNQLALFSIFSIILCLIIALFILPHFLGKKDREQKNNNNNNFIKNDFRQTKVFDSILLLCWVIFMILALLSSTRLTFNSDIKQFDGSSPEIFQAETRFHQIWGGKDQPAIFVVEGKTLEDALEKNDRIYHDATAKIGKNNFSSFSAIWPSKQIRTANALRWKKFWQQGNEEKLKKLLIDNGGLYNFSKDAFSPFFNNLYAGTIIKDEHDGLGLFDQIKERFVLKKTDGYQILSFFPDETKYIKALSALNAGYSDTFIISRKMFSNLLSESISSEIIYLSFIAIFFIPVLAFLLLKNIQLSIIAMGPVAAGIMAVLGLLPVTGLFLNAPSIIAAMVVVGLCIDYGIFMVYSLHYNLKTQTRTAITLSAITTIIGAGVLLFASHPMLFAIGITLVTGVSAGYIASITLVPSMYRLLNVKKV